MDLREAHPDSFTQEEAKLLASLMGEPREIRARQRIARMNATVDHALYLTDGFAARYRSDRGGRRQFLSFQIPGDFVDLASYTLRRLDHDIDAITTVSVAGLPHADLRRLRERAPDTFEKLWRISLLDAAIHRYWIFRIGRLSGRARIANFFGEMLLRQFARGLCTLERFALPVTQADLAEACGMTPVHANRMVAELREAGICTFSEGVVRIIDLPELFRIGQCSWDYLFLPADIEAELRRRLLPVPARRGAVRGLG